MQQFFSGLSYFFSGFGLIAKPGLRRYIILPVLVNIIIFIAIGWLFRHFMAEFNQWLNHFLPQWLQWLQVILWLLFTISFFLFFTYTFVAVANVVAAPFNSILTEAVVHDLTGQLPLARGWWGNIKDVPRVIGRQLLVIAYYLPRAALLFLLFFIPVIQVIAPPLWFLFNSWYLSLTYLDYPSDTQGVPLKKVRAWMQERRLLSLGFGVGALLATMIPVVNWLVIPAAVAGATQCWLRETAKK